MVAKYPGADYVNQHVHKVLGDIVRLAGWILNNMGGSEEWICMARSTKLDRTQLHEVLKGNICTAPYAVCTVTLSTLKEFLGQQISHCN
jgi:hypothetical protein